MLSLKVFYVISMVTTEKIATEYTQKEMRRESKHTMTKIQRKISKAIGKGQKAHKI